MVLVLHSCVAEMLCTTGQACASRTRLHAVHQVQGEVKLADFGVATQGEAPEGAGFDPVGTPYWMAPEVIEMTGSTAPSDIWSVGCLIIELFTGSPPYFDLQPMSALYRIVQDAEVPLPEGITKDLHAFLKRCFQKVSAAHVWLCTPFEAHLVTKWLHCAYSHVAHAHSLHLISTCWINGKHISCKVVTRSCLPSCRTPQSVPPRQSCCRTAGSAQASPHCAPAGSAAPTWCERALSHVMRIKPCPLSWSACCKRAQPACLRLGMKRRMGVQWRLRSAGQSDPAWPGVCHPSLPPEKHTSMKTVLHSQMLHRARGTARHPLPWCAMCLYVCSPVSKVHYQLPSMAKQSKS